MSAIFGFFNSNRTKYINLGVSKSSPNRIGQVIEINKDFSLIENCKRITMPFAVVQFRDFKENISLND